MKTLDDKATREEIISRINTLSEHSTAQWGKMNVSQMLKHCRLWEEWVLGRVHYKRQFIGRIFGRMALKGILKDDKPMMRNALSYPAFIIKDNSIDFASERAKWIALIEAHARISNPGFVHTFFGKMTEEQIGYLAYKHYDHHLRQFNS
jgi:uncharacterized protein DUF1569